MGRGRSALLPVASPSVAASPSAAPSRAPRGGPKPQDLATADLSWIRYVVVTPFVVVLAAGVAGAEVAGWFVLRVVLTAGASALRLDAGLVRLWLQRAGLLWLVGLVAWGARRVGDPRDIDTVLGLVLLAGACWWAALRYGRARPIGSA